MKSACGHLSRADPALARAYKALGPPVWRARPASYETLATSVAYQLISTKAASAIWSRVTDALPDITPDTLLATDDGNKTTENGNGQTAETTAATTADYKNGTGPITSS